MAKPRVFVSSTYIDLKHARRHIEGFIKSIGYDTVLFESGDITFRHDQTIDDSCYAEIDNCHMLVLIIGGKYGSPTSETSLTEENSEQEVKFYNSITKKEYETAREKNIPIFIFVEKGVLSEYQTFKKNRDLKGITYAHVDNVNIFLLLDDILNQSMNNYVKSFENFEEITSWLKDQWAGMFADFLNKNNSDNSLLSLRNQISELNEITSSLKTYNEKLLKFAAPSESDEIIAEEEKKLELGKIHRFISESLINFLIKMPQVMIGLSDKQIYQIFENSETPYEFAVAIGVDDKEAEYLKDHKNAIKEFSRLKRIFPKI